ncbi:MAG TPA: S-adenosylmethionine decarboxylase [Ohtaekwangia sp.]|nr:S-adenosylmethionine decarboxylase [Ohtaekwangia sp.]
MANFAVGNTVKLTQSNLFRNFIDDQINSFNLTKVGEVYHEFENGGYTAVICLTESHLSIHTWPEIKYLTFDIFLSNYLKDNRATTRALYEKVKLFFQANAVLEQTIER